jgi:hypothetical protein
MKNTDWIHLAEDEDELLSLVNNVKETSGFHKILGIYRVAEQLTASREVRKRRK